MLGLETRAIGVCMQLVAEQVRSKYRKYSFVDIRIEEISMRRGLQTPARYCRLNGRNNKGRRAHCWQNNVVQLGKSTIDLLRAINRACLHLTVPRFCPRVHIQIAGRQKMFPVVPLKNK